MFLCQSKDFTIYGALTSRCLLCVCIEKPKIRTRVSNGRQSHVKLNWNEVTVGTRRSPRPCFYVSTPHFKRDSENPIFRPLFLWHEGLKKLSFFLATEFKVDEKTLWIFARPNPRRRKKSCEGLKWERRLKTKMRPRPVLLSVILFFP